MQRFNYRYTATFSFDETTSVSSHNLDAVVEKATQILEQHYTKTGSKETAAIFDNMWKIFEIGL